MLLLFIIATFITNITAFAANDHKTTSRLGHRSRCSNALKSKIKDIPREEPNESLRQSIQNTVDLLSTNTAQSTSKVKSIVHIIGTGLTPSLLSLPLSTLNTLLQSDVVLYDSLGLSHRDICQIVPTHCEIICVGKRGDSDKSWKQRDIDRLLLQKATERYNDDMMDKPRQIVRLKGGDPFLFGRTRSEIEILCENDVAYTYTPAISSCIAGPHLGGIPLTDVRLNCQSFGVWSGTDAFGKSFGLHEGSDNDNFATVDVLVFLMIGRLDKLEALCQLLAFGRGDATSLDGSERKWNADTPCAVIQNAGGILENNVDGRSDQSETPIQRVWRSTLKNIVSMIRSEDETRTSVSPAVFVVGRVCELDLTCTNAT
jgi:siroheme synthase